MPTTLNADGNFGFDMQFIAANVAANDDALNDARFALDGGAILLASAIAQHSSCQGLAWCSGCVG